MRMKGILPFATTWVKPEDTAMWNKWDRKKNIVRPYSYVESEKADLKETESRVVFAKGWEGGGNRESLVKWYTFSVIRWIKFWRSALEHGNYS